MKKLLGVLAGGVLAINVSACGLESVVEDIVDDIEKAAEQADVEAAFNQVITGATFASLDAALSAVSDVTKAPAIKLASYLPLTDIDTSATDKDGNTITVKGTVTVSEGETEVTVDVDLATTWTGNVLLADGTKVPATSESKVTGKVTVVPGTDGKVTLTFANVGKISFNNKSYDFDVSVAWDSTTKSLTVTGKVNGVDKPATTVTVELIEKKEETPPALFGSCTTFKEVCIEFTGTNFSNWESFTCPDPEATKATTDCDKSAILNLSGSCLLNKGTADEQTHYVGSWTEEICETDNGGEWTQFAAQAE